MAIQNDDFHKDICERINRIVASAKTHNNARAALLFHRDRDFALNLVREVAIEGNVPLYHFTMASRRMYRPERRVFEACGGACPDPYELLHSAAEIRTPAMIIIEDCLRYVSDANGDARARAQLSMMLSYENRSPGHLYIFMEAPVAEAMAPSPLRHQFERIALPLPRACELGFITREELAAASYLRYKKPMNAKSLQDWSNALAEELAGLTQSEARNAVRDALGVELDMDAAKKRLVERKALQLSQELSMNILDTKGVEPPIGLDYVYQFIEMQRTRICVPGRNRSKGILLAGPPGTGKTMVARFIGQLLGINAIEFRISSLMNSYLGETEQRFERAFAVFDAMAPVVIFIDEIEKAFGEQGGERDGGTMMRCTGRLLSWLSDSEAPNFLVATANSVTRMGEIGMTMTRKGRFDRLFFVDVPCHAARAQILERLLKGRIEYPKEEAEHLASLTDKFSGADLHGVVEDASARAKYEKQPLNQIYLEAEGERNHLRIQAIYEEFNPLRRWALINCESAGPSDGS